MITSLLHPYMLTVQQVQDGTTDDSGEVTEAVTERAWGPCTVREADSPEDLSQGEKRVERLWASGPLALWISGNDKVVFEGTTYRVDGRPQNFTAGALDHTELHMKAWKG